MTQSAIDNIHDFIAKNNLKSRRLLTALKAAKIIPAEQTIGGLYRLSRSENFGLASDHVWYTGEQNEEVANANRNNMPTKLAAIGMQNPIGFS